MPQPIANIVEFIKHCSRCGEGKPLSLFWKDSRSGDGRATTCASCCSHRRRTNPKYVNSQAESHKRYREFIKRQPKTIPATIRCPGCKEVKDSAMFGTDSSSRNGKRTRCKECTSVYMRRYARKNRERLSHNQVTRNMQKTYGLTREMKDALLVAQDHSCAICGVHLDGSKFSLKGHVDHCHSTGKVRGILCGQCNTALGSFRDSEKNLLSAISYLSRFRCVR